MAEFLDGALQGGGSGGGGLTTIADVTATTAVTLLETDDIAWEEGVLYDISIMAIQDGAGADVQYGITLDGSTTGTHYSQMGTLRSLTSEASQSANTFLTTSAGRTGGASQKTYTIARLVRYGTEFFVSSEISSKLTGSFVAFRTSAIRFDNGSTTIAIGITSSVATKIAIGSKIKVRTG